MKNREGNEIGVNDIFPWIKYTKDTDKDRTVRRLVNLMLDRTQQMTKIKGLPDTMPERDVKRMLQIFGYFVTPDPSKPGNEKLDGKLYALVGNLGGRFDTYYNPTRFTLANPWLGYSASIDIDGDKDGVLVRHDSMGEGIIEMCTSYASRLADAMITLRHQLIQSRALIGITAGNDSAKKSAAEYFRKLYDGEDLGVVADSAFLESVKMMPLGSGAANAISQTIEARQYLLASWYNELGMQSNYNMKRESLNATESQLDTDGLLPLIDDIIETQNEGFDRFNKRFGTNISVERSSVWEDRYESANTEGGGANGETLGGVANSNSNADKRNNNITENS